MDVDMKKIVGRTLDNFYYLATRYPFTPYVDMIGVDDDDEDSVVIRTFAFGQTMEDAMDEYSKLMYDAFVTTDVDDSNAGGIYNINFSDIILPAKTTFEQQLTNCTAYLLDKMSSVCDYGNDTLYQDIQTLYDMVLDDPSIHRADQTRIDKINESLKKLYVDAGIIDENGNYTGNLDWIQKPITTDTDTLPPDMKIRAAYFYAAGELYKAMYQFFLLKTHYCILAGATSELETTDESRLYTDGNIHQFINRYSKPDHNRMVISRMVMKDDPDIVQAMYLYTHSVEK